MPILRREHANQHCRTCLINLKTKNKNGNGRRSKADEIVSISITNNRELEAIIKKYIDLRATDYIKDYPQNLCVPCYNRLKTFDRFCKRAQSNATKLHEILNGIEIKDEIEYDSDDYDTACTTKKENLKDSLMETESVFLDKLSPVEMNEEPDPFTNPKPEAFSDSSDDNDLDDNKNNDMDDANETLNISENSSEVSSWNEEDDNINSDEDLKKKELDIKKETAKEQSKKVGNYIKCNQCNQRFAYKTTLDAHVRLVHEGNTRPYQCEHCDKSFGFIGGLYKHMKEEHDHKKNAFCCDVEGCDRSYASSKGLSHHKRVKHSIETENDDDKKFVCEQCGMVFYQSYNLRNHYRNKHPTPEEVAIREEAKKSYECKICKRFFHSQYTLRYHNMQQHTNDMKKFECNICGRRLAKKFMLVAHMLVHSGPKTPCEHCGRLFIRKFELKEHIRAVHLKLRPYHCRYCPESFACRKTVKHHEYIHTGEKPYVCEVCGQAYRQRSCLKNHRKTHENQVNAIVIAAPECNEVLASKPHFDQ